MVGAVLGIDIMLFCMMNIGRIPASRRAQRDCIHCCTPRCHSRSLLMTVKCALHDRFQGLYLCVCEVCSSLLLQYFDVLLQYMLFVGSWPVKPTTESENGLQLDNLSTSVNIDCLTTVDNMSAVGNDSRPWVVPQSIKWLSTITRERQIPPDSESGGIPHLFGTFLSPHIGSAWRACHDNNDNNNNNKVKRSRSRVSKGHVGNVLQEKNDWLYYFQMWWSPWRLLTVPSCSRQHLGKLVISNVQCSCVSLGYV